MARVQDRIGYGSQETDARMEKKMDNEMETGCIPVRTRVEHHWEGQGGMSKYF